MIEPQRDTIYVLHWGDLTSTVRMLASAKTLRQAHKRDRIVLLTTPEFESFLKHSPFFNAIEIDARPDGRPQTVARDKRLKAAHPARVYDLVGDSNSRKLRGLFRFSKCDWLEILPARKSGEHPVDELAGTLNAAIGIGPTHFRLGGAPSPDASWVDFLARKSRMLDPEYFGLNGPFALLAPAGEEVKLALRWPKEKWASLAHELLQAGITPALVGGPDTREIGRYVSQVAPGARDITGKAKLPQLAGLARRTRFVFGEDTPLLHLLVAAGAPALALYASVEDPAMNAPRGDAPVILMHAPVLAQVEPAEAIAAMRFAGGFSDRTVAA
ncbi:glycosyltransferase family 9 protein [Maricaulis salignorans]|uniref:ADP-heptose:LPS heptosyltransferase n=1 Tax=Maricaulis salignorans TaxID=144026 RepID=A0A1G9SM05_9PROT|nr:glycosyltransferase family 9 protein [Maricaulis salignorans]SDM36506.1 ADP-heptose:LPS heptosyltransferase [Maricaulis salignorans]